MDERLYFRESATSGSKYWQNAKGETFTEYEVEFRRELSPQERMHVLRHFVLGIESLDGSDDVATLMMDFVDPRLLRMIVQLLAPSNKRILLTLLVQLREKLPVRRVGNNVYPEAGESQQSESDSKI